MHSIRRALLCAIAATATVATVTVVAPITATAQASVRCDGHRATIVGTDDKDIIEGTPRRDVINTLKGRDSVKGLGGRDIICGGNGGDDLSGGPGDDRIFAGRGGYVGDDEGTGIWYGNEVRGGDGRDFLSGGPDHDVDWPDYGSTPDRVTFPNAIGPITVRANGTVTGRGIGTDTLASDFELIVGTNRSDVMSTVGARSDLDGRGGADRLRTRPGLVDIELTGGDGGDRLDGTRADKWMVLDGGNGDDSVLGSPGADNAYPGAGNDTVKTYGGNDSATSQVQPDIVGTDSVVTGEGNDTIGLGQRSDGSTADAGPGRDTIQVTWDHGTADVDAKEATVTVGDNVARFEHAERYEFVGGDADSRLTFHGTAADELLADGELVYLASVELWTRGGDDRVNLGYAWPQNVLVHGGSGDDSIRGTRRADDLYGDDGDDVVNGRGGDDYCEAEHVTNCERP
ncbi:MAG: calcium-binding protein [Nocardioidaceae bacterium]